MHEQLLIWASERPIWQQDALRRLAQNGELTPEDFAELQLLVRKNVGLPAENAPEPVPLAAEHLNQAASDAPELALASLGPVRNVDRLAPDQPPLRFAVNGITVVYGPNASGKSGYCRIAKQLCRSQSPVALLGSVYGDVAQTGPPEVKVAFRVGGDGQPKEERVWYGGQNPPAELSRISVFDAATARVYVDSERKVEFLPYELDLMKKLGIACLELKNIFKKCQKTLEIAVSSLLQEEFHEGTTVKKTLASLVLSTSLSDLPSEHSLRELGTWTTEMESRITAIEEQLKQDPKAMISARTNAKQALEIVKSEISQIEDNLGNSAITAIYKSQQKAEDCRRAAETKAKDLFSDQPISDLGSETWRKMLKYAREFAAYVFPDDTLPPQIANGGLCVLCQQDLSGDAAARLSAFDNYISDRATEESIIAEKQFAEHRDKLMAFIIKSRYEIDVLLSAYTALPNACKEHITTISSFVENAGERLEAIKRALQKRLYDTLENVSPLTDSPVNLLVGEISKLEHEITELERVDRDEENLAELQALHVELSDRKRLGHMIEHIVEQRNLLEEHCRFDAGIKQCRTNEITLRITNRRREVLTRNLKETLRMELERLQLTHIPLDLTDHGRDAESIVKIELKTQQKINNSDILSEGEQRALALACFLAELQEIGSNHAIIVDDPVSSLDNNRIQAVAKRLADEASKGRQVIVFTHNIWFHYMLLTESRRTKVGWHREWMRSKGSQGFGWIDESNQPWQMKKVSERINIICEKYYELTNNGYDNADQGLRLAVNEIYMMMRETWERIIEEVLFNNTVQRFRPEIMTQRLKEACFDPSTDYPAIFEGMKQCSQYSGHDPAADIPPSLPDSDQILHDINELKEFFVKARNRRNKLGKAKLYEQGIKAEFL